MRPWIASPLCFRQWRLSRTWLLNARPRAALALAAFLVLGVLSVSAQAPSNGPQTGSNGSTAQRTQNIPAPESSDDRIATYTLWLAIFSGALVVVSVIQILFLLRADKTTRLSAEAARKSAEALPNIERAHVFMIVETADFAGAFNDALTATDSEMARAPIRAPMVKFRFENHGKTPASVIEVSAGLDHWSTMPEPEDIPLKTMPIRTWSFVIGPGLPDEGHTIITNALTGREAMAHYEGKLHLFLYGHIRYADVFDGEHITAFCWRYSHDETGFGPWGAKKYNYRT